MAELKDLRKRIDHLDEKILGLLVARFALSREIGKQKISPTRDLNREQEIITNLEDRSPSLDVDAQAIDDIWYAILKHSRRAQKRD
ncbi:MAG: chorismate mutase [Candidatus Saccharimonadales bacterium]|nr:chorismate mutase [Candidatus Saccharimonadales bacterium]